MGAALGHAELAAAACQEREPAVSATVVSGTLPRLLAGVREEGSLDLRAHLASTGRCQMCPRRRGHPGELVDEIERAGLRGRGGAGFPTALKMHAVAGARVGDGGARSS